MSKTHPTTDEMTQFVLDTLDEGSATGRDGHPAVYLATVLDSHGMFDAASTDLDFPSVAHSLWERVNASDLTIMRFASDEDCCSTLIESTIERVQTDALLDLSYLVRRHLRQPPLPLSA